MREFKQAAIACFMVIVLSIAGIAVWTVRAYLPIVGIVLLVVLVLAILLALAYAIVHLHHKFTAYHPIPIAEFGTVMTRHNTIQVIAPYHPGGAGQVQQQIAAPAEEEYIEAEIEEEEEMPALLPRIPSFAELLETGVIQQAISQGKLILGYNADTHMPRYGSWLDLYSAGNGGVTGSGKSSTTRFILFQAVMASAKLVMIDPHIGEQKDSLAHQFALLPPSVHQIRPCDDRESSVSKRIEWLSRELARRQKPGALAGQPLVFVIDEFNRVMRHASKEIRTALSKLLLDIEQEGRKFGIFALLIGQRWSAQDLGGADIRTSLASKLAHRFSDEGQAVRFMGSKYGKKLIELAPRHWLFYDTDGVTSEMVTPETVSEDGAIVARILTSVAVSNPMAIPDSDASEITSAPPLYLLPGVGMDAGADAITEPLDAQTEALTPQAMRVLALIKEKRGQNEIIEEIWGFKSSDGRPYRAAVEEYRAVLAELAGRIGA